MTLFTSIGGDAATRTRLARADKAGALRRLREGIYTDDLISPLESIVRREILALLAILAPGVVVSHRSALEPGFSPASELFLTGHYRRSLSLPGVTLQIAKGPGALADDIRLQTPLGDTWRSCEPRAFLENLTQSRGAPEKRRTLGQAAVEARLERILASGTPETLNVIRDRAEHIAPELGLASEAARLGAIIGTLLGTKHERLRHPTRIAHYRGSPYDPVRVDLFQALGERLATTPPFIPRVRGNNDPRLASFIESYFSNYIEGTEFEIEEAREVVLENRTIAYREDDSHDIRATFDAIEASRQRAFPATVEEFKEQLKAWNRQVIFSRVGKRPGEWKDAVNRFGDTTFVAPELVQGTLERGFEIIAAAAEAPVRRAALAMFVVAEVHPFLDGNGRTARLIMNLALSSAGLARVIIPTVYRDDYFSALHALSHSIATEPPFPRIEPYVAMLNRAAAFSRWLDCSTLPAMLGALEISNALKRPSQAQLKFTVADT